MKTRGSRQKFGSYKLWNGQPIYADAYGHFFFTLVNIALMRYKWINLPDTVDQRFLEMGLLNTGSMAFFEDDVGDIRALYMTYSQMDMTNNPTIFTVYSYNYSAQRTIYNAVPCWCNWIRMPDIITVYYYAELLAELRQTVVVNSKAQKTPVLMVCDNKERLTLENLYQKYEGGAPVIYGSKDALKNMLSNGNGDFGLKVLKTDAPYIADKIRQIEQDYWLECMTALGVDSTNRRKTDRFINSEIISDKGELEAMRKNGLIPRQECAEKVNKMFGTNISVEYNTDVDVLAYMAMTMRGGGTDECVHDTDSVDIGNVGKRDWT